jgi:hypothetical protein
VDAGDLATWFGSTFAAVAAGATLLTLKSQRDQIGEQRTFIGEQVGFMAEQRAFMAEQSATLALEREELRAAAEGRKWSQARQVQMRASKTGSTTDNEGNVVEDDHWVVVITNNSDAPIHDVEVRFGAAYLAAEVWAVNAATLSVIERLMTPIHLLGAGRTAEFHSQRWSPATVHNNRPSVTFTDDGGLRWTLGYYGDLDEAPATPGA